MSGSVRDQAERARRKRQASRKTGYLGATGIFDWRSFQATKNNLFGFAMDSIAGAVVMLLIFTYLLGGAIAGSASTYIQYLLPGVFILTIVPMTAYSGTAICLDISKGVYNRFRSMPFWQPAAILGSLIVDGARYVTALLAVLAAGLIIGFRPEGGVSGLILALGYSILFAFSASWIFSLLGVTAKRPESVSGTSMIIVYPFLFASGILVDPATMPGWVGTAVAINPVSVAAATVRELMNGTAEAGDVLKGVGMCLLMIAVFAPWTMRKYMGKNQT